MGHSVYIHIYIYRGWKRTSMRLKKRRDTVNSRKKLKTGRSGAIGRLDLPEGRELKEEDIYIHTLDPCNIRSLPVCGRLCLKSFLPFPMVHHSPGYGRT